MNGKVDAELQLLTAQESEERPAGKGRNEPDALPPPKYVKHNLRPNSNLSPWPAKFVICRQEYMVSRRLKMK